MMVTSVPFIKLFSQSLWIMWENIFAVITKFRSQSVRRYGICKLVVLKYHGESLVCQDGQRILPGDWVGELHLDNRQIVQLTRTLGADRAGIRTARMLREAMKEISRDLDSNPELSKVNALTGITLLHRGIIHGIGFEQRLSSPNGGGTGSGYTFVFTSHAASGRETSCRGQHREVISHDACA